MDIIMNMKGMAELLEWLLLIFLVVCSVAVSVSRNLLNTVIIFMAYSLVMAVLWVLLQAPDLAVTEAAVGAGVTSVLFFLTLERLESMLPGGTRVVRTMPNMAASVGESMTALAPGSSASPQDLETVRTLMETIGRTVILEEKDFSSFIGLAGSSPALVCAFIDALARAGVMGGIPKAQAVQIVAQAVLGTARTVQTEAQRTAEGGHGRTPADLIDAVCSPGGTSVAGMVALERAGFSDAVIRAFEAIVERDRELGA